MEQITALFTGSVSPFVTGAPSASVMFMSLFLAITDTVIITINTVYDDDDDDNNDNKKLIRR